jgi:hypothetical protein
VESVLFCTFLDLPKPAAEQTQQFVYLLGLNSLFSCVLDSLNLFRKYFHSLSQFFIVFLWEWIFLNQTTLNILHQMLLDPADVDNNNGGDAEDAIAALDEVAAPNSNSKSATTMPMSMGTAGIVAAENSPVPPQQPLSHQPLTNLSSVGG